MARIAGKAVTGGNRKINESRRVDVKNAASMSGVNMALHIGDQELLDQYLDLPHLWPAEDWAMVQLAIDQPDGSYQYSLNPLAAVFTDVSISATSLSYFLRHGREASREATRDNYVQRGAPGSISGHDWLAVHLASPGK
jgi:hypothetical protein